MLVLLTCLGLNCISWSLCPSLPYHPLPHVYRLPSSRIHALWEEPHAASTTCLSCRDSTRCGISMLLWKQDKIFCKHCKILFKKINTKYHVHVLLCNVVKTTNLTCELDISLKLMLSIPSLTLFLRDQVFHCLLLPMHTAFLLGLPPGSAYRPSEQQAS